MADATEVELEVEQERDYTSVEQAGESPQIIAERWRPCHPFDVLYDRVHSRWYCALTIGLLTCMLHVLLYSVWMPNMQSVLGHYTRDLGATFLMLLVPLLASPILFINTVQPQSRKCYYMPSLCYTLVVISVLLAWMASSNSSLCPSTGKGKEGWDKGNKSITNHSKWEKRRVDTYGAIPPATIVTKKQQPIEYNTSVSGDSSQYTAAEQHVACSTIQQVRQIALYIVIGPAIIGLLTITCIRKMVEHCCTCISSGCLDRHFNFFQLWRRQCLQLSSMAQRLYRTAPVQRDQPPDVQLIQKLVGTSAESVLSQQELQRVHCALQATSTTPPTSDPDEVAPVDSTMLPS